MRLVVNLLLTLMLYPVTLAVYLFKIPVIIYKQVSGMKRGKRTGDTEDTAVDPPAPEKGHSLKNIEDVRKVYGILDKMGSTPVILVARIRKEGESEAEEVGGDDVVFVLDPGSTLTDVALTAAAGISYLQRHMDVPLAVIMEGVAMYVKVLSCAETTKTATSKGDTEKRFIVPGPEGLQ